MIFNLLFITRITSYNVCYTKLLRVLVAQAEDAEARARDGEQRVVGVLALAARPVDIPKFGLTAGLPVTLEGLVGSNGTVWGLDHFGYSAPYTKLDEEFGFTAENVYNQVRALI